MRDRLLIVLPKLRYNLAAALAQEVVDRWRSRARRLEAEVDPLGSEFAEAYPRLCSELLSLFQRRHASGAINKAARRPRSKRTVRFSELTSWVAASPSSASRQSPASRRCSITPIAQRLISLAVISRNRLIDQPPNVIEQHSVHLPICRRDT
jgi:hypothetical protein